MRAVEAQLRLSAVDRTAAAFGNVRNRLNEVERKSAAFNRRQSVMARTQVAMYDSMGLAMMRFAGPAVLGAAAVGVVNAASRMEDALFRIQKKTGASAAEIENIRDQMKSMAREMPVSMEEIAAAFERGGAAGIPLDELREFAELSVKVSDAWDMSAEDVANAFAGFEAGMNIRREDLKAYADLINVLADSGIADESGIVDFIDRAGASLKQFGLAREEIAAYGAALQNLKMPAETAARAMNTLTNKLIAPANLSPKARKALAEVVGDLDDFAKKIQEDAGGALDEFFAKLEKLGDADRARVLGGLLGEGFSDEVGRLVSGLGELRRNLDLAKNAGDAIGSIDAAAERKVALWSSQVKLLSNNMENLKETLGSPALEKANWLLSGLNRSFAFEADYGAGVRREESRGGNEDAALDQYLQLYEQIYGKQLWGTWSKEVQERFRADMVKFGRGESDTPFAELRRIMAAGEERRFPGFADGAKAGAARAAAAAAAGAGYVDGAVLPHGATDGNGMPVSGPIPGRRSGRAAARPALSLAEQYRLYNEGRARVPKVDDRAAALDSFLAGPAMPSAGLPGIDVAAEEIKSSGEAAGESISQGARVISTEAEQASAAFQRAFDGVGARIGMEAAQSFRANVGSLTVNGRGFGGPPLAPASGNKGRSMPDAGGVRMNRGME